MPEETLTIDGNKYSYTYDSKTDTFRFKFSNGNHSFGPWTWGQKNQVTNDCTKIDPVTGNVELDVARFSEGMLLMTLKEAPFKINLENLRNLPASFGDTLLNIAYWVNGFSAEEKKN